ncbi:cycloisomerase 2 family protein [Schizosaccharomyces japonicus yFS275]|uniref:Cycloisomerase 2 family protein n=1 Tax=Schizosaccharomyces japonicus (strain yFS275 / FY16936) TaxID=402676 RepID=B6K0T3_SCHJY|nr:cycloisomerase 2 family protein [Schizosaccharomyces japonicus yFS275]EEB07554.1 cycloisomerase 2 family protein [Schizosaccharomyces japonicus yFS275]
MKLAIGTILDKPVVVYDLNKKCFTDSLKEVSSPTWLEWHEELQTLYVANETQNGSVSVFEWTGNSFRLIDTYYIEGHGPTSLCVLDNGTVITANYDSGTVSKCHPDMEKPHIWVHEGHSVHPHRQTSPHPHQVIQHKHLVCSVDLGLDRITFFDAHNHHTDPVAIIHTKQGYGPRHVAFHPTLPLIYVVCELRNRICVYETMQFQCLQDVSVLPPGTEIKQDPRFPQPPSAGEIAFIPDGPFLLASNRFLGELSTDTIWGCQIDANTGLLFEGTEVHLSLGGRCPRHFSLTKDTSLMAVALQDDNLVRVYRRKPRTLDFTEVLTIQTDKPASAVFLEGLD